MNKLNSGIAGEFFVAAELTKRGFDVGLTMSNTKAIDLLARNNETNESFSIQVKSVLTKNCFDLSIDKIKSDVFYVFVFLNEINIPPTYFIVKGDIISKNLKKFYGSSYTKDKKRKTINYGELKSYENDWEQIK